MSESKTYMDINEIAQRIPHRYPFLLIDRVLDFQHGPDTSKYNGRKIIARKNVSINENYFEGHFPNNPVMPGVLQVEAMAQAGALACAPENNQSIDVRIAKIVGAKFKKPVTPGDVLEIHAEITNEKSGILFVDCKMFCDEELVSEVSIVAKVIKR